MTKCLILLTICCCTSLSYTTTRFIPSCCVSSYHFQIYLVSFCAFITFPISISSPKIGINNTEELERIITLELDDKTLQTYFVHAKRIAHENREFQLFLLHKKAFVKDFICAEICHDDDEVDPSIQRKIIIDN